MALTEENRIVIAGESSEAEEEKAYKVLGPGQLRPVDGLYLPFYSSDYKDPRLGTAKAFRDELYSRLNLGNPDDVNPMDFEDYVEIPRLDVNIATREQKRVLREKNPDQPPIIFDHEANRLYLIRSLNLPVKHEKRNLKRRDSMCADAAIEFYNNKHGSSFYIVETFGSYIRGFWYHCNFRAAERGSAVSPKLFFAELRKIVRKLVVMDCIIINGPGLYSPLITGCEICGNQLLHPGDRLHGFDKE